MQKLTKEELKVDLSKGTYRRAKRWALEDINGRELMEEMSKLLSRVEHKVCARHLYANWRKENLGGDLQQAFWGACKSYIIAEFEDNINKTERIKHNAKSTPPLAPADPAPLALSQTVSWENKLCKGLCYTLVRGQG